ncbi:DUF4351 domain-containing protein [Castellaniella sp. GW247-6E4]|uniref:DUF4351 domain-containing protein n=1 Tax=Castellaniella sp. GW247-6E4 TaxID=3140380 RepID=UPI003314DFC1
MGLDTAGRADDHDSPWKEALEVFLPQCLALFAPTLHASIDWSHPPQFLDKELQAIAGPRRRILPESSGGPEAASGHSRAHPPNDGASQTSGRLYTDKLILVRCLDGRFARLLIHVEVQGGATGPKARRLFARRMYQYRYRLEDRYGGSGNHALYSLGILTTSRGGDSHLVHHDEFLGQGVRFTFPVVHMAQWLDRWDALEALAPSNPFAVVVMAQLTALRFRRKAARLDPKVDLMRRLAGYGYARGDIDALARLVDWMIALPEALEPDYMRALEALEQEHAMTYITTPERVYLRRERVEGQAELLLRQLGHKFGAIPGTATERVRAATAEQLETWSLNILDATTLGEVFGD